MAQKSAHAMPKVKRGRSGGRVPNSNYGNAVSSNYGRFTNSNYFPSQNRVFSLVFGLTLRFLRRSLGLLLVVALS